MADFFGQHGQFLVAGIVACNGPRVAMFHQDIEPEGGPDPRCALYTDVPAKKFCELFGNGQAQAGSAKLAGG